jgi:hypothetical protein
VTSATISRRRRSAGCSESGTSDSTNGAHVEMIRQLVDGIIASGLRPARHLSAVAKHDPAAAADAVLTADPVDLLLCPEQCWDDFSPSAGPAVAMNGRTDDSTASS